jgi:acetyltransferase-like isoleucine patch superfamily enzyme
LENCFIGSGAIINGNVRIGPNSIVGAGAVVTKDVPPDTIVAGVPAKKIASFDELLEKRRNNKEYSYESYEEVWSNFYLQRNSY